MMKTIKIFLFAFCFFVAGAGLVNADTGSDSVTITIRVDGVCSTTSIGCTAGTYVAGGSGTGGSSWTCVGSNGGTTASCSSVNGVCSNPDTHYTCMYGTSASNVSGATTWTWNCNGSNGGTSQSCSESKPQYTVTATAGSGGSISPATRLVYAGATTTFGVTPNSGYTGSVSGCGGSGYSGISSGTTYTYTTGAINAACTVTATFTANNAVPTVTSPTVSSITTTGATLGANVTSLGVPASISARGTCWGTSTNPTTNCTAQGGTTTGTFTHARTGMSCGTTYYYRGYATNATGTGYSASSSFTTSACPVMSGSITPDTASCTIPAGSSSCNVTLTWSTTNPVGTSAITASGMTSVSGNSGSQSFAVPYSSRTFYLYNNSVLLDQTPATSSCASGTSWNGSTCATNTYTVSTSAGANGSISPASRTVNSGSTTTFTVTPNSGYSIASASGCNGSLSGNTYTTGAITANCTVTASFSASPVNGVCATTHYSCNAGTSTNNASNPTNWTWNCAGVNGGTTASCSENKVMSGYITPSATSCVITSGGSSCNVTLTWNTVNPVATSAITASGMTTVNGNSGSQAFVVPYSSRTFYLYNNSVLLDQDTITSSCIAGTSWNGSTCAVITYTVSTSAGAGGTITPSSRTVNSGSTTTFDVTPNSGYYINTVTGCGGSLSGNTYTTGAITANCTVTATFSASPVMSGSISASDCTISSGGSTCNSTINWNTVNPVATSAVTTPTSITVANGNSGSTTYAVSGSGARTFYLYNNSQLLAQDGATATCTSGTTWNGSTCAPSGSNSLTATGCTIAEGDSSCMSTLNWNTASPVDTSTVRFPNSTGTIVATGNSGSTTYAVPYNTRTFVLVNNGVTLVSTSPVAVCASGTTWNGSVCQLDSPTAVFAANPSTIFKGGSSTLTWNSPSSDSCIGIGFSTGAGNPVTGSLVVSPLVTTTYTLRCTNMSGTTDNIVVTKVITLNIQEN